MRFHFARNVASAGPLADWAERSLGVVVPGLLAPARAAEWARAVLRARKEWTPDFGGEQFSLGRAFYTHLETDRASAYFSERAESDARVERVLPGMQRWARDAYQALAGGSVRERLGFCGAGVHVFPAGGKVARDGGVVHWDTEGLSPIHLARRARAMTFVVMLRPPAWGGGLRAWDAVHSGSEHATDADERAPHRTLRYRAGDALFFSSYRLHQIRPFRGRTPRVSITLHGVEVDRGVWDTWF